MKKVDIADQIIIMQEIGLKKGLFYKVAKLKDLMRCTLKELYHIHTITYQVVNQKVDE